MRTHPTVPAAYHLTTLTVTMLALCAPLRAEDEVPAVDATAPAIEAPVAAADLSASGKAADLHYQQGMIAMEKLDLEQAISHLTMACDWQPGNPTYQAALNRAKALAGVSRDPRGLQVERVSDEMSIKQQELWADAQTRIQDGEKAFSRGEFAAAERAFTMAHIRLENLPYADNRREGAMRKVDEMIASTRVKRQKQEYAVNAERATQAIDRQRELRRNTMQIERDRIDALLRRAQKARERRDYDDAILLCENVLKINRAETSAQSLLSKCRRERHVYLRQVTADRWDEEHKLLSENIRAAMLPQLEIVNYSPDWYRIDALRSAPTQGLNAETEEWRTRIEGQLEQKVTVTFDGQELPDVVTFLQRVTGVNIVLDPQVVAAGASSVTLRVIDMQLKYVLDYIMKMTQLGYTMRNEAIFISSNAGMRGELVQKVYDIRDLTHEMGNFPGPDLQIPDASAGGGVAILPPVAEVKEKVDVNAFIEIIKKVVEPTQWEGESLAEEYNGQMVVTQTQTIHQEIGRLLRTLRNQQATQVHVKVKFLTVENSLLEEIGVNWQNFDVRNLPRPGTPNSPLDATTQGLPGQTSNPAATGGGTAGPNPFGVYHQQGSMIGAGVLNSQLGDYSNPNGIAQPYVGQGGDAANDGLQLQSQYWKIADKFYISGILRAVEKEKRGNVLFEPDLTMFNGQQAHVANLVQQAYVSDYDVNQGQYQPVVSVLSYGTVLDVQPIVSADKKYITLTVRPSNAQIIKWRRFGRPNTEMSDQFGGGSVQQVANPDASNVDNNTGVGGILGLGNNINNQYSGVAGGNSPLMMPEILYQAVRTSVTIPDGGSILLAGYNNSASRRAHTGVPFLSHIPFLGRLFSANGRNESEMKTMILLQADVVLYEEIEKKL